MLKLRTFIILIVIYLIAFFSIKFELNLFYPYDLLRNYLMLPVIATAKDKENQNSDEYNEVIINNLKEEINELKELSKIKTVLSNYESINATVIERNRNYWFNTIKIDKGTDDGVTLDMAVVDKNGLIGKISHTTKNMSEIKLITTNDVNNKTSVVIQNGNEKIYGIISGYRDNNLEVIITSSNTNIKENLNVSTTGMGGIYPSGILIGKTVGVKSSKYDVGLIVLVKPFTNFDNLRYISVLRRE